MASVVTKITDKFRSKKPLAKFPAIHHQIESYFHSGFWGNWLPQDINKLEEWRRELISNTLSNFDEEKFDINLYPECIQEFYNLIEHDPQVFMLVTEMIKEIPKNDSDKYHLKSVAELMVVLNKLLTVAPEFNDTFEVGTPFSAVLIWTMGTTNGLNVYRNEKINNCIRKILLEWKEFLNSSKSLYVFNTSKSGWVNEKSVKKLNMDTYEYNPDAEAWGFKSWNDFFTRKKKAKFLEVDEPDNNKVIVQGCDSTVYRIRFNVCKKAHFWIKTQPYSLQHMLGNKYVDYFTNGCIYQAYLSPFNYHRWHSPVSGTIKEAFTKQGLYFSQTSYLANLENDERPADHHNSQGYITQVQTRSLYFIECDDKDIGLICFMPVGMVEVSSCTIHDHIKPGYHVKKGEELGYFQFGGSTHCIFFREGVIKEFCIKEDEFREMGKKIAVAN